MKILYFFNHVIKFRKCKHDVTKKVGAVDKSDFDVSRDVGLEMMKDQQTLVSFNRMGAFSLFLHQVARETLINVRQLRTSLNTCLFFLMIVVFFPLTMPPDSALLRTIAPGLVWIAILLALFLTAERLFQQDYADGVIEQWLVSGYPLSLFICAKMIVHWWVNVFSMLLFCPVLALLFELTLYETLILMLSLVCGTPAILSLCALAAALSTGLRQQGVLTALVLLPLTIPIMIFGSAAVTAAMQRLAVGGYLALLMAISLLMMTGLPFAIAGVIRANLVD